MVRGLPLKMRNTEWENRYKENGIKFETRVNT